jgi:hypothetical protein
MDADFFYFKDNQGTERFINLTQVIMVQKLEQEGAVALSLVGYETLVYVADEYAAELWRHVVVRAVNNYRFAGEPPVNYKT